MFSESHPLIRRTLRFIALPYCYFKLVNWKECTSSWYQVIKDLLYIFFKLKYFPDNYTPCRFWEKDRKEWCYYYGSSYHSYQRYKLRKEVQTYDRQIVFNDKVICEQLCKGIDVLMPRSFGVIKPDNNEDKERIKKILNEIEFNRLIIKPILGHAGRGIVLAIKKNNEIFIKSGGAEVELEKYNFKEEAIIQEVVTQIDEISAISSSSINTIRVLTLYTKASDIIPISSSMRFGVGESFVDNWSAGGIAVGVDYDTGRLKEIAFDKYGKQYKEHPVSKVKFLGFKIPMWNDIIEVAIKVQRACSFYKLIGMDIAVTKKGPILIEVNANPDIVFQEQTSGPLFKDRRVLIEFAKYNLLINDYQKGLTNEI